MARIVRISGKIMSIHGAAEKMNNISLDAGDFPDVLHVFNLDYPSEVAITNSDVHECSIRFSSQDLTEAEIIKAEAI